MVYFGIKHFVSMLLGIMNKCDELYHEYDESYTKDLYLSVFCMKVLSIILAVYYKLLRHRVRF